MRRGLPNLFHRVNSPLRLNPRRIFVLIAALVAISVPLFLIPSGSAQRKTFVETPTAKKSAPQSAYRSPGNLHKVEVSDKATAEKVVAAGGRLVADYSTFSVYEVDTEAANSLAAEKDVQTRDEDNLVQLNAGAIDTTKS